MLNKLTWIPFVMFLLRDLKRFYKVKVQTIVMPIINYILYLVIFGVSLGRVVKINDELSYLQFIIPGLITLGAVNNAFQNGSSSIFVMKITGEIIDIKSTTLSFQQIIWAVTLSSLTRGLIVSLLTLCVGELFHYFYEGFFLPIHSFSGLLFFIIVGGAAFGQVGLACGIWAKSFDHVGAISGFIVLPLIYLGGVFFDLDKLSLFWQKISLINPLFYFVNGMRWSFLGKSDIAFSHAALVSVVSLIIIYSLCFLVVRKGRFYRIS